MTAPLLKPVIVTTSWDDGHRLDLRIAEMLDEHRELLRDDGMLAPSDPTALALALDQRAQDPNQLARLRERALVAARRHTWEGPVRRLERVFAEVVS